MTVFVKPLLLQVRDPDDPMRGHEVEVFARALEIEPTRIAVFDLLNEPVSPRLLAGHNLVLLGGSGEYSAAGEGEWLERALESLRVVHGSGKPTFASCWGFQAMARAMGGRVITDRSRAEVGTHRVYLTEAGCRDPILGPLAPSFLAQMGHEDHVVELPPHTTRLAFSDRAAHQAYRFDDAPIYCTQFHPELTREDLHIRVRAYPRYIREVTRMSLEEFEASLRDSPEASTLLPRFVEWFVASRGDARP